MLSATRATTVDGASNLTATVTTGGASTSTGTVKIGGRYTNSGTGAIIADARVLSTNGASTLGGTVAIGGRYTNSGSVGPITKLESSVQMKLQPWQGQSQLVVALTARFAPLKLTQQGLHFKALPRRLAVVAPRVAPSAIGLSGLMM